MSINDLRMKWKSIKGPVLPFYGHASHPYACFSNFYKQKFILNIPESFRFPGCPLEVEVQHSEQAIMLLKAALFGDARIFDLLLHADKPLDCKKLGRQVSGFQDAVWNARVTEVALIAVKAKFEQNPALAEVLCRTQDMVLCEASPRDKNWGVGMGQSNPDIQNPSKWKGANILGWALMHVRDNL